MNADAPTTPPADTPPADPTSMPPAPDLPPPADVPPPPAAPLTWPAWFRPFDMALAVLAVVLAFSLGSFVARNPDLWRHLAAGRMITQFQYPFGGDPFTYTAESRPWVNAHWLGEVLLYVLQSLDSTGAVAVGVKAIAFAAAVGLLFLLRKPGAPLWPWAVLAAAGAVAAGAFTHLRPQVFALPVMAGILAVIYTGDWLKGNKWRMPAILGGLTAVWANVDSFAFLSPLVVGLILAGDWLDAKLFSRTPPPESGDDPFRASPPRPALWRALLLCVVGFLLNPTFLGGLTKDPVEALAQLVPFELDSATAEVLKEDPDLHRYTYSVFHLGNPETGEAAYLSNPILGGNPAGLFAVVLWVLTAVAVGASFARGLGQRHGRLSHLLVWLSVTLLAAVVHARFVPYSVLVTVPLLAAHLNGFGRWVPPLAELPDQFGRVLLIGCRVGRVVCLLGLVVLLVAAVPGWLHPWNGSAAGRRYVGWAVTPDEGLKRAGEVFARWHADPDRAEVLNGTHGMNTHPDLGDYLAYYAPAEKTFVTSRYRLHRDELPDLMTVRQRVYLGWDEFYDRRRNKHQEVMQDKALKSVEQFEAALQKADEAVPPPVQVGWLKPLVEKHGIGYVSVAQAEKTTFQDSLLCVRAGFGTRVDDLPLYGAPWHLDGRLMVVGKPQPLREGNKAGSMTWDVAREVFGPQTPPESPPDLAPGAPPQRGWEYDLLLMHPPTRPIGLDDADAYCRYIDQLFERRVVREQLRQFEWEQKQTVALDEWRFGLVRFGGVTIGLLTSPRANGTTFGPLPTPDPRPEEEPFSDQEVALPFLAARAARAGLRTDPNSPGGFISLAQAFGKPTMPRTDPPVELFPVGPLPQIGPSDIELQIITALRRAIGRLPAPGGSADEYTAEALRARVRLTRVFLEMGVPQQVVAYRLVGKDQIAPLPYATVRVGYVDAARNTLNELNQVLDGMSKGEAVRLGEVARGLVPLWEKAIQLCAADFWMEFRRYIESGQVPPDWWARIDRLVRGDGREMANLLVETDYLKKDDWTGWQTTFAEEVVAGKVDEAAVRDRLKRLYDVLDRLVARRLGRIPRPTDRPADAFAGYVSSGLFEKAVEMVLVEEGKSGPDVRASGADIIRLLLWVGRAEEAQQQLGKAMEQLETLDMSADSRAMERAKYRLIECELAKLNGDYAEADVIFAERLFTPVAGYPPLLAATLRGQQVMPTMTDLIFPDLWLPTLYPPLTDAELDQLPRLLDLQLPSVSDGLVVTGGGWMIWAINEREQLRRRLLYQAFTHYQRGVYALLGGNPALAREQFDKAADPQGISRFQSPIPDDASEFAKRALPVQRLGPASALDVEFGTYLPKFRELLAKYAEK